ncbi:MAG: T9SS type A sorting domain-containing protein [Bacteroidia bacterium]
MKNFTTIKLMITMVILGVNVAIAQNPFKFKSVSFVGAMDANTDWTIGWTNWNPEQTTYPSVNETTTLNAAATSSGKIEITTNITLDSNKVYLLTGFVYVKNGGTLNIPAGTVIRGEGNASATPANYASIIIQRGGKINATGRANKPVIFTSNKAVGSRKQGDWGGILLFGKATNNLPGGQSGCTQCVKGEGLVEGPFGYPDGVYGGSDDGDNSGVIIHTRIEFPGMIISANNEINGLTLGSVGYGTKIESVQVSFSNDDSYEWFGGAVNARYIVAYKGTDDDFDTDFGYHGNNQFGIGFKDSVHYDQTWNAPSGSSTSEGFESDNDGSGSTNTPKTSAIFSNFTMIGPYYIGETYSQHSSTVKGAFRRGARIRRNSAQSVLNSIFMGYRNGLMVDGSASIANATSDELMFRNNLFLGMAFTPVTTTANSVVEVASATDLAGLNTWFTATIAANRVNPVAWSAGTLLVNPSAYSTSPNLKPVAGSPALSGADFSTAKTPTAGINKLIVNGSISVYPNPSNGTANVEIDILYNATLTISVVTLEGKVIRNLNDTYPAGKSVVTFDGLSQGVYIVKVAQDASFNTFKLIVK